MHRIAGDVVSATHNIQLCKKKSASFILFYLMFSKGCYGANKDAEPHKCLQTSNHK